MPPTVTSQSNKAKAKPPPKSAGTESVWDMVQTVRMLCFGVSGTGKTTFAASHPGRIKWLVCSGGKKPGELRSIDTPENRKRIHPVVLNESEDFKRELGDLDEYDAVVLDHASGLADILLKEILNVDELPEQRGWGTASQQQYGQLALQCKESFRALLNAPCDVIVIAQERVFGGADDGGSEIIKPTIGAALTPSVVGWLNPACDYVVQTYKRPKMVKKTITLNGKPQERNERVKDQVEYCLRTGPDDVVMTKFRVPRGTELPHSIVDPSWSKFLKIIAGKPE